MLTRLAVPAQTDHAPRRPRRSSRRGFTVLELLLGLAISALLMAASVVSIDFLFNRYTTIADSAQTQITARVVIHRMLTMVRTGSSFQPYPADITDPDHWRTPWNEIEFLTLDTPEATERVRIERRASATADVDGVAQELRGPFTLWLITSRSDQNGLRLTEVPLLDGVERADFFLQYELGNRLVRATFDLTVRPVGNVEAYFDDGSGAWRTTVLDASGNPIDNQLATATRERPQSIRIVASAVPQNVE